MMCLDMSLAHNAGHVRMNELYWTQSEPRSLMVIYADYPPRGKIRSSESLDA